VIPFEDLGRVNRPREDDLRRAFGEVLASGRYVLGEQVAAFERELAAGLGAVRAVGTASGYDALTLACRALGMTGGEVIVPANTCPATILAVARCGLDPVLSDPDPGTLLMDPRDVERRIGPRTVAILPVHLFGLVCDMPAILDLARRHGLLVVEDCAQAQGALCAGRPAGTFGHAAAFSFYPTKNLGALGDGGAVVTGNEAVADNVVMLRNYGYRARGVAEEIGLNSRLDEIQAAFLRVKLPRLPEVIRRKNDLAARYDRGLDRRFIRPRAVAGTTPARHLYPVLHPDRDAFRRHLSSLDIGTEIHYPTTPRLQRAMAPSVTDVYPVTEMVSARIVSLPLSTAHTDDEIDRVIEAANSFLRR
jgi:dTDP-4-amino-4,6-dideoxygalactose transaminase